MLRLPLRQSISIRLSALISGLLIVAIATFSIVAHLQLKRVLLATAAARATSATHVLGGFMEDSERRLRMEGEKLAADPAVRRFASFPTAANRGAAQKSLTTVASTGTQTIGVELRDKQLQRTLWIDGQSSDSAAFIRNPENKSQVTRSLAKALRFKRTEDADEGYQSMVHLYEKKIYPSVDGIRNVIRLLGANNEKIRRLKAEDLVDDSAVRKMEKEGRL